MVLIMEFLILVKILVDILWDYKVFNILYIFSICILSMMLFFLKKNNNFVVFKSEFFLILFFITIIFAYLQSKDFELASIDFVKLLPLAACYMIGRLWKGEFKLRYLSSASLFLLLILFFMSLLGLGYEYWGNVNTFVGFYYFKTDLAIAVLISVIFILASNLKIYLKGAAILLGSYLVFEANSRIAIPIMILQILLYYLGVKKLFLHLGRSFLLLTMFVFISIGVFSLIDFSSLGMVGFDISDPFSDSSTQGRNHIWDALITYYNNSDIFHKIFGSGLASDILAARQFSDPGLFEDSRAHNSYLWMLVCVGWSGIVFFFIFLYFLLKSMKYKTMINEFNENNFYIFLSFLMVFLIMSMSVEVIVRTQLTFIMFFYAGLCSNTEINRLK